MTHVEGVDDGHGYGVKGYSNNTNGKGVYGNSEGQIGVGVLGFCADGIGVFGIIRTSLTCSWYLS
jgi:hypothetical protein